MTDQFDGDLALQLTKDGGDISYIGGQPQMDAGGLETAVLISLFTGIGWWGNALEENEPNNQIGSDFEPTIKPHSITIQRLRAIEQSAILALEWMVNINAAKSIDVSVTSPQLNEVEIEILITKPEGDTVNIKYQLNWEAGFLRPVNAEVK